jgi:hypothetical protein
MAVKKGYGFCSALPDRCETATGSLFNFRAGKFLLYTGALVLNEAFASGAQ